MLQYGRSSFTHRSWYEFHLLSVISLPRCVVPPLRVLNPTVKFGRCFLKHPYQQEITLVNDSDVPGCYGLLPQVWPRVFLLMTLSRGFPRVGTYLGIKDSQVYPDIYFFPLRNTYAMV